MADRLTFSRAENRSHTWAIRRIVLRRALSIAAVVTAPWLVIAAVICAVLQSWWDRRLVHNQPPACAGTRVVIEDICVGCSGQGKADRRDRG